MDNYYETEEELKREVAENFVYSCVRDMMISKKNGPVSAHTYNVSESEFCKYLALNFTIREIAKEENLDIIFSKGVDGYQIIVKEI